MIFRLWRCDPAFFENPPFSWRFDTVLNAPPSRVFSAITEDDKHWFPNFRSARWLDPPGPGARRAYQLSYMSLEERFLDYEPGQLLRFYVSACTLPLLRRFGESYELTELPDGTTRLRWQVGYEPHPWLRPLHPVLRLYFARDFRAAMNGLCNWVEEGHGPASGPGQAPRALLA